MRIPYQYPIVYLDDDDFEYSVIECEEGYIHPIQIAKEPYECTVEARGYSFHLLFGSQINGNFLCIPDWSIGCELASLDDQGWNLHSLLQTERLDYEESTAIIFALAIISGIIQQ